MKPTLTKYDKLKARVIALAKQGLLDEQAEIESGIEDTVYEDSEENRNRLAEIEKELKEIEAFENTIAEVYVYVEGGNIQGSSANTTCAVHIFDMDNYKAASDEEREEAAMDTPEAWEAKIEKLTKNKTIKPTLF